MKMRILAGVLTAVVAIFFVSTMLGRELYAGRSPGIASFALIHFAGYLFFLLMPVEALVPLYQAEGHAGATLIAIAVSTALAAQSIDYLIGRSLADRVIDNLIGQERYDRFKATIEKWGGWAILFFNLLPLSSPNMLLVSGMIRYSARKALAFSLAGLLAKYVAIVYIFDAASWWMSRTP